MSIQTNPKGRREQLMDFEQEARKILQNPVQPVVGGLIAQGVISQLLAAHNEAIQQERQKAAREALEDVDMVARSIGDLYMTDNGSELHDYLIEALKEQDNG